MWLGLGDGNLLIRILSHDVERKACTGQGKHSGILIGQLIKDRMHVCQVFFAFVSETYMYVIL